MPQVCRVALLGQKFMARAHSNAYLKVARFFNLPIDPHMHTIVGRDLIALAPFADRWGWQNYSTNWKEVVKNPEVDFIDISTPNYMHAEQALAAIAAGKHVAVEKPLALSIKEARQMRNAAVRSKRSRTFVWYNYRRVPALALAERIVAEGRLGRLYHVRASFLQSWANPDEPLTWRFQKRYSGFGAHGDLNAQVVDLVRFITGDEFVEIQGAVAETFVPERFAQPGAAPAGRSGRSTARAKGKVDVDDALLFVGRLARGTLGVFEGSRLATGNQNQLRIEINGEGGALKFELEDMNYLWFYDQTVTGSHAGWTRILATRAGEHPYTGAWWPNGHSLGFEHTYINTLADIMASLGGEQPIVPLADFADAYETQRVLEAAYLAVRNRCAVKLTEIK